MRVKLLNLLSTALNQSGRTATSYSSAISLRNLHPHSSLDITTPVKAAQGDGCQFSGYIPVEKLDISYCRSPGPGGQHVNKVNTKVDVRFHLMSAEWLDEGTKAQLSRMYRNHLNKDGFFIIRSDRTRSQHYNQADAITRLREIIFKTIKSLEVSQPSEETLLTIRKRKERANIERLARKRNISQKKADRQVPDF